MTSPSGPSLVTTGGIAVAGDWGEPDPDEKPNPDEAPAGQEASS